MAKYKNIKSAIHNWAHSFMSIENFNDHSYFVKALYTAAKAANAQEITINVLAETIAPVSMNTLEILPYIKGIRSSFINILTSQNVSTDMVVSFTLSITYDFNETLKNPPGFIFKSPWKAPEAATYSTRATAVDNRGIEHTAEVPEWWR
ncbi:hypothetical protein [Shewanella marisflavi]|uniref:Uncharacterized protein n=1 Tax=Shewanella marisflavi TaxID=260364 RepID=A0AAC9XMA2_9GAMM|nr:hypothetical protein [Shewanella marisflavi]ASJ95767.1 hypothetical protein CFF01_03700 [Shewanella marisflavi]